MLHRSVCGCGVGHAWQTPPVKREGEGREDGGMGRGGRMVEGGGRMVGRGGGEDRADLLTVARLRL